MKTRRQATILDLIQKKEIDTQEGLLHWLREAGFDVTQATISRDIKELRLIKSLSDSGKYRYTAKKSDKADISSKFHQLFSDSVLSVDYAMNLVVVQCMSGMAQAVCAALDSIQRDGIVGTIAGDDTIFIAVRTESGAIALVTDLKKMIRAGQG